ncbi:MAG TPA: hypothetical protein VN041_01425, partial [Microbacterium sp.]|nr:hypothetical protein [Microbacterium sp.]
MTSILLCAPDAEASMLASDLELEGVDVRRLDASELTAAALDGADALLIAPTRSTLTAELIGACDRAGVRVLPVGEADT